MLHQGEQSAKSLRSNTPSQSTSLTPRQLFYKVKDDIRAISKDQELTYDNIQPAVGQLVAASLDEDSDVEARSIRLNYYSITQQLIITMPTWVHDSHSSWVKTELGFALRQGFFSDEEWETMKFSVGTAFDSFARPYEMSWKQPDLFLGVEGVRLPTIVFEVGWSQSHPQLIAAKNLWLQGGANDVNAVFLIRWTKVNQQDVKGILEVYRRGGACEGHVIFPEPAPGTPNQTISLTRGELFGPKCDANKNPQDAIDLRMDSLRRASRNALYEEGYRPLGSQ